MYENIPNPSRQRFGLYEPDRRIVDTGSNGWLWMAGIAVAVLVALLVFGAGGDGTTSSEHPGGAGAPLVEVPASAPAVPPAGPTAD